MSDPKPLFPGQARNTLANRLSGKVDRLRQLNTRFGLRADRVFLVWTRYDGEERGEGAEKEVARFELLPTPRVSDQTSILFNPYSAGVLPSGSVRVDQISARMTTEVLMGHRVPDEARPPGAPILEPTDFFWEIVRDDRGELPLGGCCGDDSRMTPLRGQSVLPRARFRIAGMPELREGGFEYIVALERVSEDRQYNGESSVGVIDAEFEDDC